MHTAPAPGPLTLPETGSSLMAPLFALWGPAYHSRFSQVTLSADPLIAARSRRYTE